MGRNILLTTGEGQTGHLTAELLLKNADFKDKLDKLTVVTLDADHSHCKDLSKSGAAILSMKPGDVGALTETMQNSQADTVFIIPPSVDNKMGVTREIIEAATAAGIPNMVLLSSAGTDMADPEAQPRLREFIDIETLVMKSKEREDTAEDASACIIRAGFYAENLLLYNRHAQERSKLPLPIGAQHRFAPVALGDVALVAAHVLTGTDHSGQLITLTGPRIYSGPELAEAASSGLGTKMEFAAVGEEEAGALLDDAGVSDSEKRYIAEYYALVRAGKTAYVSTLAFHDITGQQPQEMSAFFKGYEAEFKPKKRRTSRSKKGSGGDAPAE